MSTEYNPEQILKDHQTFLQDNPQMDDMTDTVRKFFLI